MKKNVIAGLIAFVVTLAAGVGFVSAQSPSPTPSPSPSPTPTTTTTPGGAPATGFGTLR